ncbi:MAG TPA: endonuclease/exonuclease/phosphatase family protein [Caulobacterales bacterium]|nr:endonuclease/exonuclease/phosphatase family protein [Caulobacterales bacterium]
MSESLGILTWNLGYAGLGAGSDFFADGGSHRFPPSHAAARANADAIAAFLWRQDADAILLQEIAAGGPANYWVDLKHGVEATLHGRTAVFEWDFRTRFMPWPLAMRHGQGLYVRGALTASRIVPLPNEPRQIFGVQRRFLALSARLGRWTLASVHLAAFDAGAELRAKQLAALMRWAEHEHAAGQRVVIGGDWNLRLAETNFPSTTEERFLFWIFPFPAGALPPGWRIAADAATPSVRTNERPYRRGQNYRTVIDGFVVSPGVAVDEVRGVDLDFQHSDHNPVFVRVSAE